MAKQCSICRHQDDDVCECDSNQVRNAIPGLSSRSMSTTIVATMLGISRIKQPSSEMDRGPRSA